MIKTKEVPVFDGVEVNGFIRAKYRTWPKPRNDLISFVTPEKLTCLFQTSANSTVGYFVIKASEVAADTWDIKYSTDLEATNY